MEGMYMEGMYSLADKKDDDVVWEIGGFLKVDGICCFDSVSTAKIRADGIVQLSLRPDKKAHIELEGYHDFTIEVKNRSKKIIGTFSIHQEDGLILIYEYGAPTENGLGPLTKVFKIITTHPRSAEVSVFTSKTT